MISNTFKPIIFPNEYQLSQYIGEKVSFQSFGNISFNFEGFLRRHDHASKKGWYGLDNTMLIVHHSVISEIHVFSNKILIILGQVEVSEC